MRESLYRAYRVAEAIIAPGLQYSQSTYGDVLDRQIPKSGCWLDLGCGHQLLPNWDAERERRLVGGVAFVVGLDPDSSAIATHASINRRVCGLGDHLPFKDGAFDVVTMNMVVEHLDDPVSVFREARRVLRIGGHLVFHTPNLAGYATQLANSIPEAAKRPLARLLHGRAAEDVYPTRYRCNTRDAITQCASEAGLVVEELLLIRSSALTAAILPLALVELAWLRALDTARFADRRPNIIASLRRDA